ncbi:sulfurtransferase-like selenium metabolism protein YedF [Pseudoflavonifractor sp. DSM 107456]|uniref:Sulfurtransferase-like selenium metabolism protein YedF n=1 Tax=Pseudoflavonifractor gallinarum TaxID=2779352 RepID=A0ABR9RDL7_9FIRM|nr:sulfurtransferase-like selenium metabolism protein YedF [Pseudoflavonifractor gallinarum]MBE5056455.1 sulfurtransferase-like selenium metabolism protein YedF [Pseudoflavonifractor gallinarum]
MSRIIDAKGKACPMPVLMAKEAISAGESQFTVLVDNTTAVGNLQRLAANQGFDASVEEKDGAYCLSFLKNGSLPVASAEEPVCAPAPSAGYAIFVGRDIIGDGDRELGTNLMRMFFYTLAQSDDLPRSILFMNAGVKLPAGDEQVAQHLQTLLDRGVEVLVCGTCLNFYGIADQLAAGTVSNMYDILTRMQEAGKVISL